jgi:hypothetical protein
MNALTRFDRRLRAQWPPTPEKPRRRRLPALKAVASLHLARTAIFIVGRMAGSSGDLVRGITRSGRRIKSHYA